VAELEIGIAGGKDGGTQVRTVVGADCVRVILTGDIDLQAIPELEAALVELATTPRADTQVDLAGVTFLSSTGLEFLARLHRRVTRAGHAFTVLDPTPVALRVLTISGFTRVMEVVHTAPPRG
jgi:anti-anti-sigma factor